MLRIAAAILFLLAGFVSSAYAQAIGEKALNDQVRAQLAEQGDDGTASRPVDHWAFPDSAVNAAGYNEVADFLQGMGFTVEPAAGNGGIKFSNAAAVADARFDDLTLQLTGVLPKFGWRYDGWETVVIRTGG